MNPWQQHNLGYVRDEQDVQCMGQLYVYIYMGSHYSRSQLYVHVEVVHSCHLHLATVAIASVPGAR